MRSISPTTPKRFGSDQPRDGQQWREMGASSISSKGNSPRNEQQQLEECSVRSQASEPFGAAFEEGFGRC